MNAPDNSVSAGEDVVLYEVRDGVATVTMNRPRYHNAQNSRMTYAIDACFLHSRRIRESRIALIGSDGKELEFAGPDVVRHGAEILERHIGMAANQIGDRGSAALIGNVDAGRAGLLPEQGCGQVVGRARAG